ncbi:MAG: DUF4250 family protein [Oscillospiraceae bacterium]|nr:DUF4250 family protein [Oscillospiraceae bacterium]
MKQKPWAWLALLTVALLCGCSVPADTSADVSEAVMATVTETETETETAETTTAPPEITETVTVTENNQQSCDLPDEFYEELFALIESYPHFNYYDISLAYRDIETGYTLLINPDRHYFIASVMKAPYMLYIYRLALDGEADLEQKVVYTEKYRREGTGAIKDMEFGTEFTVEELIGYALEESDNSAFAMLRELYPEEGYVDYIKSLGVTHEDDAKAFEHPQLCCETALIYARGVYDFIEEQNPCSENLREHMTRSRNAMIIGGEGAEVVRKYGWYEGYFSDMAVVYGEKTYLLSIMTNLDLLEIDKREYDLFRDFSRLIAKYCGKLTETPDHLGNTVTINIPKMEDEEMVLPKDPYMLLSVVNMKLRDNYPSFEALCEDMDVRAEDISAPLDKLGYGYDEENNQFVPLPKEKEE